MIEEPEQSYESCYSPFLKQSDEETKLPKEVDDHIYYFSDTKREKQNLPEEEQPCYIHYSLLKRGM